jgi:hypothetical protein
VYIYTFFRQAQEALVRNLADRPQVGFATRTTGEYAAFATLSVDTLEESARLLVELSDGPPVVAETAVALDPSWLCAHPLNLPRRVECYVQIQVNRLAQVVRVRQELLALDLTMAATIVAGHFNILLHLGADTFAEVERALLYDLPSVPDIGPTSVALAGFDEAQRDREWFWRPPQEVPMPSYKTRLYGSGAAQAGAGEDK